MEGTGRKSCNNDVPLGQPVVINNLISNVEIMVTFVKETIFLKFCFHLYVVAWDNSK